MHVLYAWLLLVMELSADPLQLIRLTIVLTRYLGGGLGHISMPALSSYQFLRLHSSPWEREATGITTPSLCRVSGNFSTVFAPVEFVLETISGNGHLPIVQCVAFAWSEIAYTRCHFTVGHDLVLAGDQKSSGKERSATSKIWYLERTIAPLHWLVKRYTWLSRPCPGQVPHLIDI